MRVNVPAGIADGQTVRLAGQGAAGVMGGPAGDIIAEITVLPHPALRRDGADIRSDVRVSFAQAALGAEIEVQTVDGRVKYEIPPGTQSETAFRLRGKGVFRIYSISRSMEVGSDG